MNISHLRSMALVAEHGSFSAASKELFITPVSLMQQINLLENDVGFKIFNRTRRGVTLTEAGTRFYAGIKRSLKMLDILIEECREIEGNAAHNITVGIYPPYSFIHLCNAYHQLHPEIQFFYIQSEYGQGLNVGDILKKKNCDIMQETYSSEHITAETESFPIKEDRLCCYCSSDHPLAKYESLRLEQLLPYDVYYPSDVSIGFDEAYSAIGGRFSVVPFSDIDIHMRCSEGAIYILEQQICQSYSSLTCIPIEPPIRFCHSIVYRKNTAAHVQDFIHFIRQSIGESEINDMEKSYNTPQTR